MFPLRTANAFISEQLQECQTSLHCWGHANQVVFDAGKEHVAILSHVNPEGNCFKLLGVDFDPKLLMGAAIHECVVQAGWKLRTVLCTRRSYTDADLLVFFKAHI